MSIKDMYYNLIRNKLIKEIDYTDTSLSNLDLNDLVAFEKAIEDADTLKEQLDELQEEYDELFEERDDLESEFEDLKEKLSEKD